MRKSKSVLKGTPFERHEHAASKGPLRVTCALRTYFETLDISTQRLQVIAREIDRGHASGGHFGGGMFEELRELLR